MAIWRPAFVLILMSACSPAPADDGAQSKLPVAEAAVEGSPAPAAIPAYYPPGYAEMKDAAAIFAKENFGKYEPIEQSDDSGSYGRFYDVEDCQGPYENAEIDAGGDPRALELEAYAREIAKHRHYLSQLYQPAVFEEPLRNYERGLIEHLATMPPFPEGENDTESPEYKKYSEWSDAYWTLKRQFAEEMENRRKRLQPDSLRIDLDGGCGAGEVAYLVRTDPVEGRLWMTTKFSFDLCKARKVDPWNTEACRWTEISPSEPVFLSGRYVYQAKWPGGAQRRAVRAFDGFLDPEKGDAIDVVIRAP